MSEVKFTKGKWKVEHMGGSSTVLVPARPRYNNTATPPYGYRDGGPFCVATIFQEDSGHIRRDFVAFSHDDAHLIATSPDLYEALLEMVEVFGNGVQNIPEDTREPISTARRALAKARGES